MKFPLLGIGAFVVSTLGVALAFVVPEVEREIVCLLIEDASVAVALVAAVMAALAFGPGDRMRLAWATIACGSIFAGVPTLLGILPLHFSSSPTAQAHAEFLVYATFALNALNVAGLALFASAWRSTGFVPPRMGRATLIALFVGLVIGGPAVARDVQSIIGSHNFLSGGALISDIGDIASITLTGPLVASAIWMRGGLLIWPFLYLAGSCFTWLVYDFGGHLPPRFAQVSDIYFSALATFLGAAAAFAHRAVVRSR